MKKLVGILLFAALTTCYLSSCGKEAASGSVAEVWTEDAQAKILRNAEYEDKTDRSIDIQMARNEYRVRKFRCMPIGTSIVMIWKFPIYTAIWGS